MAHAARARFTRLAAEWLRVGYTQSNFNADNCLLGGVTVDYGPFGFIEKYDPAWVMWVGGGQVRERDLRLLLLLLEMLCGCVLLLSPPLPPSRPLRAHSTFRLETSRKQWERTSRCFSER